MNSSQSSKDIIDYPRNLQKASEIESKVNGINLWALIGSLAFIFWQLIQNYKSISIPIMELFLRVCIFFQVVTLVINVRFNSATNNEDSVRFQWSISNHLPLPFLSLLSIIVEITPAAVFLYFLGITYSSLLLFTFNVIGVVIFFAAILRSSFLNSKLSKLPQHLFMPNADLLRKMEVIFGLSMLCAASFEVRDIIAMRPLIDLESLKFVILAVVCYWLSITLMQRKNQSAALEWTYSLERDLLLGRISASSALRRIEHRSTGARLSEVLDDFFSEIEARMAALEQTLENLTPSIAAIEDVPIEYSAERAVRFSKLVVKPKEEYNSVMKKHEEFSKYLEGLIAKVGNFARSGEVLRILSEVCAKHRVLLDRMKKIGDRLSVQ